MLKEFWTEHFDSIGLEFATSPVNGILWIFWGLALAYVIYSLLEITSFSKTLALSWLAAFFMMWITAYNLQVLPLKILIFAVPLSLAELAVAALIIRKISGVPYSV